jgi:hypothetical protein
MIFPFRTQPNSVTCSNQYYREEVLMEKMVINQLQCKHSIIMILSKFMTFMTMMMMWRWKTNRILTEKNILLDKNFDANLNFERKLFPKRE